MQDKSQPRPPRDTLPLIKDCEFRRIYKLECRNLKYGVFDGKDGFIGIRTKFKSRFLFREYHWDQGAPYGTVRAAHATAVTVPECIGISESLGTRDENTGAEIFYDRDGRVWRETKHGTKVPDAHAVSVPNKALFDYLEDLSKCEI